MLFTINSRGFNLFSALVAAVLIMVGVLLVNTMTFRESSTRSQVYSMKENFGLADAANIARADAIQTFSHYFRKELEDYLAFDEANPNYFTLLTIRKDTGPNFNDWDSPTGNSVIRTFERSILLEPDSASPNEKKYEAVVNFVAQNIVDNFQWAQKGSYGRYRIKLSEEDPYVAQAEIKTGVSNAIETALTPVPGAEESIQDFFEIVECTKEDCPLGTFYFNLPLDKMSQTDYENLPRIIVTDTHTGEEIKIPLLPREKLRIYIPLRFLKAVHEAWLVAKNYDSIGLNEEFGGYELGFCDSGCAPRDNPEIPKQENRTGAFCPESATSNASPQELLAGVPAKDYGLIEKYPSGGENPGSLELQKAVIGRLRQALGGVTETPPSDPTFVNEMTQENYLLPKDYYENSRDVWEGFPFKDIVVQRNSFATKQVKSNLGDEITAAPLYCTQVGSIEIKMLYREKNKQYIVDGKEVNGENVYGIKFVDENFTKKSASDELCISDPSAPNGGTCSSQ